MTKTTTLQGTVQAELVDGAWVGESDFYKVTFEVGGNSDHKIVLNDAWVTGGTNFNLNLFLYESLDAIAAENPLKFSTYNAATETISLAGVAAGTYYVEVRQALSSDYHKHEVEHAYSLEITPPAIPQDDYEENDKLEDAYDLGVLGSTTLDASTGLNQEFDYFKFTTAGTADETHFVEMSYAQAAHANLTLALLDAQGNVVANYTELATTKKLALKDANGAYLPAGDYYVRVCNVDTEANAAIAYALQIEAPQVAPAAPTTFQTNANESADDASLLVKNETTLVWNNVYGETGYELRYATDVDKTDAEATWTSAGTVAADVATFDTGALAYGTVYKYQIRAVNQFGESAWVDLEFSTVDAPKPPTGLKASVLDSETLTVELSWDDVDHELGYEVELFEGDNIVAQSYRLPAGTTSWKPFVDASDPDYTTRDKLSLGTTYEFRVTAYNNAEIYGVASEIVSFTTENVPTAPTGESWTLVPAPQPTATLSWNAVKKASDAEVVTDYVVTIYEQVDGADGDAIFTQTVDAAQTSLTLEAGVLEKGASYRFAVVAVNAYGESAPSTGEGAYVTVGDVPTQPTVPTATVNASTAPTATLTWGAVASETVAETVTGYEVTLYQIVVDADGETTVVAFEPQTVTEATYTTETLDFGGTYYFEVAAVNVYGASEVAKSENFTVGTVPTAPTELTADLDEAALTASLSWTAASNHTGYRVELQTQNADGETVWEIVDNLDAAALTWSTDVAVDTTYLYRVVAWSAYGEASETVEVVVENVPTQPTDVKYSVDYVDKAATLTWTAVDGATGYVVEQLGADGAWAAVAGSATTETTWTSAALDFGTSYSFRVVAKNAYGSSDASDAVSFTIQDAPTVVTSLADGVNLLDDVTTLREAIYYAQDGAEIVFDESLRGGTIALTGGEFIIQEKEISVRGFVDENGAPQITIDGADKSRVFLVIGTRASFFGLSVVNGSASYDQYGGAYGGGFCFDNANAILTNVDVIDSQADVYGGGVYIGSNADAPGQGKSTLTNVRIIDNVADNGEASGQGGGLYAVGSFMGGELEMTNVEISGNRTQGNGGGLFLNDITSTLTNVKITDNIAEGNGGAFYADAPDHAWISDLTGAPLIVISTKLTNVEITGNQAYKGFGFYAEEYDVEELSLRNVTFADNAGTQEGALGDVYLNDGAATFYNSIFVGDVQGTTNAAANAYNTLSSFTGWANATEDGVVNYVLNEGDSVFAEGSYALAADSVALNKGDNAYVPETLTTDLAGNPRVYNDKVDVGAYESLAPLAPTNLGYTQYTSQLNFRWTDVATDETGYRFEYRVAGTEEWTEAPFLNANAKSYVLYDFERGVNYEFRVRAENEYGVSEWVQATATTLTAPTGVAFGEYAADLDRLPVSWDAVENAGLYRVEVSTTPFESGALTPASQAHQIVFAQNGKTSCVISNVEPGQTYYVRVKAFEANGSSSSNWSESLNFNAPTPTSEAFADAFDELDFFVDEDELDALAKRLI